MYQKIGTVDRQGVYVEAQIKEGRHGPELSIHADIRRSGHYVAGGQDLDTVRRVRTHGTPAPAFRGKIGKLLAIWKRWHLNGLNPGCEHQRAAGWHKMPMDAGQPLNAYRDFGGGSPTWNMRTWIRRSEHPQGLMCEPCWICGYKYGTEWKYEALPPYVFEFVEQFNA